MARASSIDALRRHRVAHDRRPAAPEDARLLAADRLAVVAEDLGVVDVDAGEDRAVGIEDVDRVEAAAQADLEDDQIERRAGEQPHDGEQRELEVGQRDVAARRLDRLEVRQQGGAVDAAAVDAAALLEADEMRLREQPDAIAGGAARSIRASRRSSPCRWCRRR